MKLFKIGKIVSEEIDATEAHYEVDAINTLANGKRGVCYISYPKKEVWRIVKENNIKSLGLPSRYNVFIFYNEPFHEEANELYNIAEKYNGYLSVDATDTETIRIGELLSYKKEDIIDHIKQRVANGKGKRG